MSVDWFLLLAGIALIGLIGYLMFTAPARPKGGWGGYVIKSYVYGNPPTRYYCVKEWGMWTPLHTSNSYGDCLRWIEKANKV